MIECDMDYLLSQFLIIYFRKESSFKFDMKDTLLVQFNKLSNPDSIIDQHPGADIFNSHKSPVKSKKKLFFDFDEENYNAVAVMHDHQNNENTGK